VTMTPAGSFDADAAPRITVLLTNVTLAELRTAKGAIGAGSAFRRAKFSSVSAWVLLNRQASSGRFGRGRPGNVSYRARLRSSHQPGAACSAARCDAKTSGEKAPMGDLGVLDVTGADGI